MIPKDFPQPLWKILRDHEWQIGADRLVT